MRQIVRGQDTEERWETFLRHITQRKVSSWNDTFSRWNDVSKFKSFLRRLDNLHICFSDWSCAYDSERGETRILTRRTQVLLGRMSHFPGSPQNDEGIEEAAMRAYISFYNDEREACFTHDFYKGWTVWEDLGWCSAGAVYNSTDDLLFTVIDKKDCPDAYDWTLNECKTITDSVAYLGKLPCLYCLYYIAVLFELILPLNCIL